MKIKYKILILLQTILLIISVAFAFIQKTEADKQRAFMFEQEKIFNHQQESAQSEIELLRIQVEKCLQQNTMLSK